MDPTNMQQTVMDSSEVYCGVLQPPMENVAVTPNDMTMETNGHLVNADNTPAPVASPPSYDELFPALPSSSDGASTTNAVSAAVASQGSGNWGAAARNNDSMRIESTCITQVFIVNQDERAKIDGNNQFGESASSSICADITKKTGAHIEISSAKDNSLTFLVTGKRDAVPKARKLVLEKFQAQNSMKIKIPKDHHKFLLGKKGKKLQELETSTSTKIQVPGVSDPSDMVTIKGTRDCIDRAVHEIRLISDEHSKHGYEVIEVPKMYHPFVCGGNNQTINKLMSEYGVRINVPPHTVEKNDISIAGDTEAVLKVKDIIESTYKNMEARQQTVSVEVAKAQHKYVIGPKRCNVAEILDQFNVSVEMPPQDSPVSTVTLRGPPENLGAALTMVYSKASSMIQEEIIAPTWLHRYIIGRKGANIKQVTAEFPQVHVEFTDKGESIKVEGPREEVQKAKESLERMIGDMKSRLVQDQIQVDPKYHKHIIGKSGTNINRIRNESNVIINIDQTGSIIKLEGAPEDVQQVKRELMEQVKKMENEKERELNIEHRLHRNIIGQKGEKIREIRDLFNQVQISLPDPGEKSDSVRVRGPKEDVDKCCKYLLQMAKELKENNFQIRVPIFKQFVKFIIGKSGSTINKIRNETDTRIEMPVNSEGADEIVIVGKKENCEKARDRIQQIQNEMANIVEVDIIVPAKFHNSMIGQRGRLIRSISEDCGGVSIKFPPADKKSDKVTIRGPKEDVQKAKKMLVELSNEKQISSFSAEVRCKLQHHKFLIGKSGATIKKLREDTGARIIFPTEKDDDKEVITIIGKKDQVAAAQASLEKTIKQLDNISEGTVAVPQKHHLYFIQRKGEVLRQIGDQFGGVSISFPRNGQNSDQVTIKGAVDCVSAAKVRILEIVAELDSQVSIEVEIPQRYHRTVMGPRGSCIQSVTSQHNVQIKFPDRASSEEGKRDDSADNETRACDIVRIKGSRENCEAAKQALLDLVPITDQVEVPFKFHRFIIGQRGQSVKDLMTTHDVNIQVPPAADNTDIIKIVGLANNVASAKQALLDKVVKLEEEELDKQARQHKITLNVDPEYHPKIIGRKGAVVSKIRDKHGVNIQFPQRTDADPTLITIIGYEKSCENARDAILAITGDLATQIKISFEIDNRVHARLIGQRGRAIRKVMDDYKVSISFPRSEENPDTVTMSGAEANVENCKEHLLNLAEEYMQDILDKEEMNVYSSSRPPPLQFGDQFSNIDINKESDEAQQESDSWGGEDVNYAPQQSRPMQNGGHMVNGAGPKKQGFVVSGAPWAQEAPNVNSSEDFPSMGAGASNNAPSVMSSVWGPKR